MPALKPVFSAGAAAAAWLEGPVDRYGLALFLSGKATGLATVAGATLAVRQGFDVQAALASWGLAEAVGSSMATLAGAAALNAVCVPLHFAAAVYGVQAQEK